MGKFKLGKNTRENLESILKSGNPASKILVEAIEDFMETSCPIDFCILKGGGFRTPEDQKSMFDRGVSKCDGYTNKSEHQKGLAVDLVPWINGKPSWHRDSCFYLAGAFISYCRERGIPVTSGSDWDGDGNLKEGDSWDPCHMQIKDCS